MPSPARITSRQHEIVQRFRSAARRNGPDQVLLDGEHLILEAIAAGIELEVVLADERHVTVARKARGARVFEATASVIEAASPVKTPSGIVALACWRPADVTAIVTASNAFVVGLCNVQDPGNVGSVVRAAHALGATGLLALDGCAHPAGWKALRGAMGSTFRLPIAIGRSEDAIDAGRRAGLRILATVPDKADPIAAVDLTRPSLVLLGSEGAGLEPSLVRHSDQRITIPMAPHANSLNVAAAAAVVLYEARQQRR